MLLESVDLSSYYVPAGVAQYCCLPWGFVRSTLSLSMVFGSLEVLTWMDYQSHPKDEGILDVLSGLHVSAVCVV